MSSGVALYNRYLMDWELKVDSPVNVQNDLAGRLFSPHSSGRVGLVLLSRAVGGGSSGGGYTGCMVTILPLSTISIKLHLLLMVQYKIVKSNCCHVGHCVLQSQAKSPPPLAAAPDDKSKQGRLITIPLSVLEKIDTKAPFALKLNNETFRVDPSSLFKTAQGVITRTSRQSIHILLAGDISYLSKGNCLIGLVRHGQE